MAVYSCRLRIVIDQQYFQYFGVFFLLTFHVFHLPINIGGRGFKFIRIMQYQVLPM